MNRSVLTLAIGFVIVVGWAFFWDAQRRPSLPELHVGALYSVLDEDSFGFVKVLAVDQEAVHLRVYKNRYRNRPAKVDPATLTLGTIHDTDGFGMGHLPLSKRTFVGWQPMLISDGKVSPEELDGYQMWKESAGGYFE